MTPSPKSGNDSKSVIRSFNTTEIWLVFLLILFAVCAVMLRPVGVIIDQDDAKYVAAAVRWTQTFPYVGVNHWELRHPFVLQLAAIFLTGGRQASMLALPMVYFFLVLALSYTLIRYFTEGQTAFIAVIILATSPVLVESATSIMPELIELFFILGAIFIILIASERALAPYAYLLAGTCIGLGWLTRETSGAIILFLILTFLFKPLFERKYYLWIGASALMMFAIETIWLAVSTGDVLYRMHIDMKHIQIPSSHLIGKVAKPGEMPMLNTQLMRQWVPESEIKSNWFLDPYVAFFTTRKFGILFYALIPALLYLSRNKIHHRTYTMLVVLNIVGIGWFLFATYIIAIRPQARYFMPLLIGVDAVVGVYLMALWKTNRLVAMTILTSIVVSNLLLCDLQRFHNYPEDAIIDYTSQPNQLIHISSVVAATLLPVITDATVLGKISFAAPVAGDIILLGPDDEALKKTIQLCNDDALKVYQPRRYLISYIPVILGESHFPQELLRRIDRPDGVVKIGRLCNADPRAV